MENYKISVTFCQIAFQKDLKTYMLTAVYKSVCFPASEPKLTIIVLISFYHSHGLTWSSTMIYEIKYFSHICGYLCFIV